MSPDARRHAPILGSRAAAWRDEADCAAAARALAAKPELRDAIVELSGALGAGKTSFVRQLLRALGVSGRVKSPTYALLEPYELQGGAVYHFDFFRLDDAQEWEDAGFRELYAGPGLKIAEWPEKAAELLPLPDLLLTIAIEGDERRNVRFDAFTARGLELLP